MLISGSLKKDGKFWLVEIPLLDYMTQGLSKKDAYKMAADIVESGVHQKGFAMEVIPHGQDQFYLRANNSALLIAHMLRRLRQKHGLTVREAAKKLGSTSPNAYAAYEQGRASPSIEKLEQLLKAVDENLDISILAA